MATMQLFSCVCTEGCTVHAIDDHDRPWIVGYHDNELVLIRYDPDTLTLYQRHVQPLGDRFEILNEIRFEDSYVTDVVFDDQPGVMVKSSDITFVNLSREEGSA